ncbi:MAG TPA: sigma-54 dependent transcriptional regulator [Thermodesulfobacteriota bacterium]
MTQRLLIVDDEAIVRSAFERYLSASDYVTASVESAESALARIADFRPDVVLTDIRMAGMDGLELTEILRERDPDIDVIVVTGAEDMQLAIRAIRAGAYDYLVKPVDFDHLGTVVARCVRDRAAERRARRAAPVPAPDDVGLVGRAPSMVDVYKLIGAVAGTRAPVLIQGETGTGKELVARAIHANSAESAEPFLAVNCTALPETLLESELFGHVRGSFTGAVADRKGHFELAGSGTIFLDEIGDISPAFQAKLLRILQERTFIPVGAEHVRRTEARVIAATHRDLARLVRDGLFRDDLYFRLKVVEIHLPPLRDRRADIPLLVDHLLRRISVTVGKEIRYVPDEVMARLVAYDWPGNVRELENVLSRSAILARGSALALEHLPPEVATATPNRTPARPGDALADVIAAHVHDVLARTNGNKRQTARILGISRSRLDRLLASAAAVAPKQDGNGPVP